MHKVVDIAVTQHLMTVSGWRNDALMWWCIHSVCAGDSWPTVREEGTKHNCRQNKMFTQRLEAGEKYATKFNLWWDLRAPVYITLWAKVLQKYTKYFN